MNKFGSAIILAGGKSTRMGFDKQFIKLRERSLMENLIQKLRTEFEEIIIVTNKPELYIGLAQIITEDIIKDKGPLGGIHAGLMKASSQYSYVIACDMPTINMEYILFMEKFLEDYKKLACITRFGDWIEPFNSFYSKALIPEIEEFLRSKKMAVNSLLKENSVAYVSEQAARMFSPDWDMFFNLNTKEDISQYLENWKEQDI